MEKKDEKTNGYDEYYVLEIRSCKNGKLLDLQLVTGSYFTPETFVGLKTAYITITSYEPGKFYKL